MSTRHLARWTASPLETSHRNRATQGRAAARPPIRRRARLSLAEAGMGPCPGPHCHGYASLKLTVARGGPRAEVPSPHMLLFPLKREVYC